MEAVRDLMKTSKNQWESLDDYEKIISMGKLKMLEHLASYIECLQLSYTKQMLVNGIPPTEDEKEIKDLFKVEKKEEEDKLENEEKEIKLI